MARAQEHRTLNEVVGLVLLGLGTLLFLALISYTPRDLPGWFPLSSTSRPNRPPQNFIGPLGAIGAGSIYFLLGAGSYLVAAVMLGLGGVKLMSSSYRLSVRSFWVLAFVLSGACLLDLQPWFLHNWPTAMNIRSHGGGAGGWLGYWVGERLLRDSLGAGGAGILLICLYVTTIILMTGIQPIRALRGALAMPSQWIERHRRNRLEGADERERLVLEEKRLAREAKKLEKVLSKKGAPLRAPDDLSLEEEEPMFRPEPKVIDTSVPQPKKPAVKGEKGEKGDKPNGRLVPQELVLINNYTLPDMALLEPADIDGRNAADPEELRRIQATVIETLAQFGISVAPGDITKGPTITRYEVYPAKGVRVDKIVSLERDIARSTRAERINILAPIPGKDTVGIEIANSRKQKVTLRELLESEEWTQSQAKIPLALGKDVYGKTILADLSQMPHCLVAGTTGSGKSVCINALIASMLYRFTPDELRLIMIDPKVVEMQIYNRLPHLITPVVTDPKKVLLALRYVIDEMEKRYKIFAKTGVRNITGFNARPKAKIAEGTRRGTGEKGGRRALRRGGERRGAGGGDPRAQGRRPRRSREDVLYRRHHRRAGGLDADRARGCRERDRAHHADGAGGGHPYDRRHADAEGGHRHGRHQGKHPQPHRVPGRHEDRQPGHPGRKRRRTSPGAGGYALRAAGHLARHPGTGRAGNR